MQDNLAKCNCPNVDCKNHGVCCQCIARHREMDGVVYCQFNSKDKSMKALYEHLKSRFESA